MLTPPEIQATMYALAFLEGVAHTHPTLAADTKARIDKVLGMAKVELDAITANLHPAQLPPVGGA